MSLTSMNYNKKPAGNIETKLSTDTKPFPGFPNTRMRRTRQAEWIRELVQEHSLSPSDLILPAFVIEGTAETQNIPSMPGVQRHTIDMLVETAKQANDAGIKAIALFPSIDQSLKNPEGSEALNPGNLICRTIQAIKNALPDMGIITDVALDPYTSHGHDGILKDNDILNDETLEILARQALLQASAGADVIAPSDMMDGRIGVIRQALENNNHKNVLLLSYTAKYASSFYGPFRDAVQSGNLLKGDKKTYQMNPANTDEALREAAQDIAEGADILMVKPGLPYLDIIHRIKTEFKMPLMAYQVSGEYAMIQAAHMQGWLDYETAMAESLMSLKRAGCDAILTYGAMDIAKLLQNN